MTAADVAPPPFRRDPPTGRRSASYGVHALVGDDEAGHRWRSDDRVNLYSVSKGVSALAAGIAVG